MKIFNLNINRKQNFDEIHQYVEDLESVIHMRDKLYRSHKPNQDEIESFDRTIKVMQKVLEHLNSKL